MKIQITKQIIEKTEIILNEKDTIFCHNCEYKSKNTYDEFQCSFYDVFLPRVTDLFPIRCYKCIRSGKEIE